MGVSSIQFCARAKSETKSDDSPDPRGFQSGIGVAVRPLSRILTFVLLLLPSARLHAQPSANADKDDTLRFRLMSMIWDHGYSVEEASAGLGLTVEQVSECMTRWGIHAANKPMQSYPPQRIKLLPWEPGRHPRIGFLEGAIDPLPDTKVSIFLPWENAGYVVFDLPEAVFSNLGLIWLAHTHIPTIWDERGVRLETISWKTWNEFGLTFDRTLPNKISFGVNIEPDRDSIRYEYWLRNGTDQTLTGLRSQLCVLLKNAPDFNEQTRENKLLRDGGAAVRSRDGRRWIITECERAKPWDNPKCPCMHADPTFEDCPPGARVSVRGRIWFSEKPPWE